MSPKLWPLQPAAPKLPAPLRRVAAAGLRGASAALEALAQRLEAQPRARRPSRWERDGLFRHDAMHVLLLAAFAVLCAAFGVFVSV